MLTVQRINRLAQDHVLECVDASLRVVIAHTSPSHFEGVGEFYPHGAQPQRVASGPMNADLLAQWLETLPEKCRSLTWAEHPLDPKTRAFIGRTKTAPSV